MVSKQRTAAGRSRHRISRRLILYIILFSSLITLLLTTLQLIRDYRHDVGLIQQRLQQIELTTLDSISRSAWTLDTQAIRLQLEGLLKLPDIIGIELTWADDKDPLQIGRMPTVADIDRTYELTHVYHGREINLGHLRVAATLKQVYRRLIDTTLVILAAQGVKTFLVTLFILMVFERLVTRHLATMARFTRQEDLLHTDHELRLSRSRNRWNQDDELQQVADAINHMASNTRQAFHELHEERARQERLANIDALTGLPNRHQFMRVLSERLGDSCDQPFSVLLSDLDGFKDVNDSLGHQAGDLLLRQLRSRLEEKTPEGDLGARLGGDEFAFLINGDPQRAMDIAKELHEAITRPFDILNVQLSVGVSIGIAHCPTHSSKASDLLRFADVAMYAAKRHKEPLRFYVPEEHIHGIRRLQLMSDLRHAIEQQDQLQLHYQPQVDINTGRCIGAEALLRWQHPQFGWIRPDEFIPVAEKSDLMRPLTRWVANRAIQDYKRLQLTEFAPGITLSLNVSSRNLQDKSFAPHMMKLFHEHDTDCSNFILEITESAIMRDPKLSRATIQALSDIGFGIGIDDFGTGYSSLAYIKHLPVNEIKIDRTFVADMLEDGNDAVIVKSTIDLSHNLGLRVIAEGVENPAIIDELLRLNCDLAQGYHYARPMPADDLINWLARHSLPRSR